MINMKSPYDSRQIREGLMSIKQSQMELLRELKNENHILKKYSPQNPILQERSQSKLYDNSASNNRPYSIINSDQSNYFYQSNQKSFYLQSNQKPSYLQANQRQTYLQFNQNPSSLSYVNATNSYLSNNNNNISYNSNNINYNNNSNNINYNSNNINYNNNNNTKQQQDTIYNQSNHYNQYNSHHKQQTITPSSQKSISQINIQSSKSLQDMKEQYHRMKKNYFNQKQKNKDMILHMQFAASLHNTILKDVLQSNSLQHIRTKIRQQVESYRKQFPQFKAFGIQQAFNIINLQSDNLNNINTAQLAKSPPRRTQIFSTSRYNQQQTELLLKEINELKSELKELSLQKQRKCQQVRLVRGQREYNMQVLSRQLQITKRQLQMRKGKIEELLTENINYKQTINTIQKQNTLLQSQSQQLNNNIIRLKSQLQRNLNKIQTLESYQKQSQPFIDKQHQFIKKIQSLQHKINGMEKQSIEKVKLNTIQQNNIVQLQSIVSTLKLENDKLNKQSKQTKQQLKLTIQTKTHLQQQLIITKQQHNQQLQITQQRNQTQQSSLKQHIEQLKLSLQQLLRIEQSYKQSQYNLCQMKSYVREIKQKKLQGLKMSKTVDHLWKIKQVEYSNIEEILTQLNLIHHAQSKNNYNHNNNNNNSNRNQFNITKEHHKRSSKSKSKSKPKHQHQ